jgi:hypothetical protein
LALESLPRAKSPIPLLDIAGRKSRALRPIIARDQNALPPDDRLLLVAYLDME